MTPVDIRKHSLRALSESQREAYFTDGFVVLDSIVKDPWLKRLQELSAMFLDESRNVTQSNEAFDLGPGHSAAQPRMRRLRAAIDRHPDFWRFACESVFTEIAADLVGPDVKFHSAKLNYKWPGKGEVVKWHQDIPAWPHTNYSPVTLGVYLDDVTPEMGPLVCIPGSHEGELFRHTGPDGAWTGSVSDEDTAKVDLDSGVASAGPAGTVVAINCRTIHGSQQNSSSKPRPMLLYVYSSADAFTWMPAPSPTSRTGDIVCGKPADMPHMDPRPCPVPPNWDKVGYGSIYTAQKGEHTSAEM